MKTTILTWSLNIDMNTIILLFSFSSSLHYLKFDLNK